MTWIHFALILTYQLNVIEKVAASESKYENIDLGSPVSDKNIRGPIYAEVRKTKRTNDPERINRHPIRQDSASNVENGPSGIGDFLSKTSERTTAKNVLDVHTLTLLWMIFSGCNVEECLLEGNEMAGVNFGAFLPTDQKVLKLLLEAGAIEQTDMEGCDYGSQVSSNLITLLLPQFYAF